MDPLGDGSSVVYVKQEEVTKERKGVKVGIIWCQMCCFILTVFGTTCKQFPVWTWYQTLPKEPLKDSEKLVKNSVKSFT